jgi:parallel beta-helix repeat protein
VKSLNRKTIIVSFWLLAGLAIFIWPGSAATAQEVNDVNLVEDPNLLAEPRMPGTIEGTGTYFEVNDSNYLNITFQSSQPVHLRLESAPQMVIMDINAVGGVTSTQITLGGFAPSTTYYMYEDNYHNKTAFATDANGGYSYVQDLAKQHLVFIQPQPGTIFLSDSGWSNPAVGTWDPCTKTGTLMTNVNETIQIDSDGITLDGNGYTVNGPGSGFAYGVYLSYRTGVTIKNINVRMFYRGISLLTSSSNNLLDNNASNNNDTGILLYWQSNNNTLIGNTTSNNGSYGIGLFQSSNKNTLISNTASNNNYCGIILSYCGYNSLSENLISNNYNGIWLYAGSANTLTGNIFSNNQNIGIDLYWQAQINTLINNTVINNSYGIRFYESTNNKIYNNNFIDNTKQIDGSTYTNVFNLAKPIGGNFWSDWTTPDADGDGFVDYPYVFTGGKDNLPWTRKSGWLPNQPPVADANENIQITSANQAYTIIQGKTTDPDGDPLTYRWLEVNDVLLDWSDVGANGEAYLDLGTLPYFSIGNHTLTLEVSDGIFTDSDEMILTVQNSPPEAQPAPAHQVVEIGIDPIVVVADVLDFDGDTLSYQWLKDGDVLASGNIETVQGGEAVHLPDLNIPASDTRFPLGVHTIELKVNDGVNNPVSAYVSVEVSDTTAPSLSPIPSVTILWPPNHQLRPVTIYANAFDNGGGTIHLDVTVESSEPPDANGDGSTIPDYYIDSVDDETGTIELQLRSERSGNGDGRTYTITITATDESGNQSTAIVEILAPHDRRKK